MNCRICLIDYCLNLKIYLKFKGFYNGSKVCLVIKLNVKPIFYKPRPILYAYREAVNGELNRLMNEKVIEEVDTAELDTP